MTLLAGLRRLFGAGATSTQTGRRPDRVIHCSVEVPTTRPHIVSTLGALLRPSTSYIPAAAIAQKAKSVADGIFAALEGLSTAGDAEHMGVGQWLEALERQLALEPRSEGEPPREGAVERIRAARDLGRSGSTERAVAQAMLANPVRSRPLGFYTWSTALSRGFARDRFLREALPQSDAEAFASILRRNPSLRDPYVAHLRRIARLTNRLAISGVQVEPGATQTDGRVAIFPASTSGEERHGGGLAFLDAVKSGRCDLRPEPESGFYAHQRFALEPLLLPDATPEAAARTIDLEYAAVLERLAALAFFFGRETHVKQLQLLATTSPTKPRIVYPELTVEPVPSFYRLTGDAFRFLREVIADGWGDAAFASVQLRSTGPSPRTIAEGLDEVVAVCDAASLLSTMELDGCGDDPRCAELRARLRDLCSDEDVAGDARGMVPLSLADEETGYLLAMVFVGWEVRSLQVRLTHLKGAKRDVTFGTETHLLPVPVVRELAIDPRALLDRDALRALCDRAMQSAAAERGDAGADRA